MPESQASFKRHIRYFLFFAALFVLGWGITPYQDWFLGLLLGTAVSFYNHWLLYQKVKKFTEAVAHGGKAYTLGTLSRMAAAVLAVVVAVRYPDYLNVYGVIIGIMTSYIVIIIDSFARLFKSSGEER
jgi:ATP synthase protein I